MIDGIDETSQDLRQVVDYIGPFESHRVVVNGWEVPLLAADPLPGGKVSLTLDDRYALDLPLADAERIVPFIANAIAVALGYARHPDSPNEELLRLGPVRPRRLLALDFGESEEPSAS
jgi:hypothetical protein